VATDGTRIIVMLGSEGLYAFDMNGKQLWKQDFGVLDAGFYMVPAAQWEFSSSPVLHDGVVIVLADVQKGSFIAAHDAKTGKQLWRTARTDVPTFGSPTIHQVGGRAMVLVNGWRHTGAYDFKTGEEIWKLNGGGDIPTPTPIAAHGLVYITNAHGKSSPVFAIKETAKGDISLQGDATTNEGVAWTAQQSGSYMSTPVVYGDVLYVTRWQGILHAFDARTGERLYQQRLGDGGAFTASTIAGDGKLYMANEDGDVFVIKAGRTFEQLAKNTLGESLFATPAISEGVVYFRTSRSLIAVR
jgi:outer membrane protein assembly factor BamB